ncbi:endonuclease/exonuclease/phosphatase family protein [Streptomyces purpureus]|uniref:Endonuclease/exonuclease/phosphatase domain-containing protein n=1 Tax=Streptomyces purpureus TaxID=1951 RepID=A0A918H2E9_9ACTN|nr:endonuclease/exonuclease/phosphatase family protein [Streptomyces purpureus]GGT34441.1 hypothetical protein GCM10014713_30050 [Streptomyces purpureus]
MKKILAMLGAALLPLSATPAASATGMTTTEVRNLQVMSWNMCGVERWNCQEQGTAQQKIDVVKYHVEKNYVQAALLQEICKNDADTLLTTLNGVSPGWKMSFQPYRWSYTNGTTKLSACKTDADGNDIEPGNVAGTAIVVKAGLANPTAYNLPQPRNAVYPPFHCATATWWDVRLCNAHVVTPPKPTETRPDLRKEQIAEIKRIATSFPKVVLGGDFNTPAPDTLKASEAPVPATTVETDAGTADIWGEGLYGRGPGTPGLLECDQEGTARTGRPTYDGTTKKLDYLFSNQERRWCAVADSAYSDHHVLIKSMAVTVPVG